ncbi:DNRLRE domain-containing protein [Clostridium sp.]|uniref:DNRLRE domain-containing protein n=1 Tax=Clostridium sp. TaxID=1506 RepID=UPI002FC6E1FA
MRKYKRFIALVLTILFLSTTIPKEVLAESLHFSLEAINENTSTNELGPHTQGNEENKKDPLIISEIKEKRDRNVKYFLKEDFSYEMAIYPEDVHYYEDGQWKDIDNSLEEATVTEQDETGKTNIEEVIKNKNNDFKVKLAKHSDSKNLVRVSKGKYEISWSFNNLNKVKGEQKALETPNLQGLSENEAKQIVKNTASQVNFYNAYENIDLQYNIIGQKLKENFIINKKTTVPEIQFQVEMKNLTYKLNENNSITFFDEVSNEKVFQIDPPIMYDAAGEVSTDVKFAVTEGEINNSTTNNTQTSQDAVTENTEANNTNDNVINDEVTNITDINNNNENKEVITESDATVDSNDIQDDSEEENKTVDTQTTDLEPKATEGIDASKVEESEINDSTNVQSSNNNSKKKNTLNIAMKLNSDWINSESRVYPITIDPTIGTSIDTNKIQDTFVLQNSPTANRWNTEFLATGNGATSGINRSLLKFDLPALTSSDMVVGASLNIPLWESDSTVTQVNVHKITKWWDPLNTTWSNQPSFDPVIEDYDMVTGNYFTYHQWDITKTVKEWYTTGLNYGIMLKNNNEGETYNAFVSSDSAPAYAGYRPIIGIQYVSNSGLESYWTYHSQSVGRAGNGYVNDYNGNVVHIHNDIAMTGSRNPININHVYNSNNLGYDPAKPWMGRGWNLNVYQWLVSEKISGQWYYKYTDSDGTNIYFKDNGTSEIKDDLNQGYTLTIESGGYWKNIKDKNDNKIRFFGDVTGSVESFTDRNGNKTTVKWEQSTGNNVWMITALTDAASRTVKLRYNSSGYLTEMEDASGLITKFILDPASNYNNLTQITYPDGKSSKFNYYPNYNLHGVTNIDNFSIWYEYTSSAPYRAKRVYEWNNNLYGNEITMEYGNNTTTFTDTKGRKEIYQFDNSGQTISIKDSEDKAQHYKYNQSDNKSKLNQSSKLQSTVVNQLVNHNAELTGGWTPLNASATVTTEDKYLGSKALKLYNAAQSYTYFSQYIKLTKGKTYTLSGYVKTKGVTSGENLGATLAISYKDAAGQWQYVREYINGTTDWTRYEKSFTLPSNISDENIWIAVEMLNATGTAYFDSLQLEEGQFANRYNLIENSDFTLWDNTTWKPLYWTSNTGIDATDYVAYDNSTHPMGMNTLSMRINGNAKVNKGIYQNVNIAGKKDDVYVLGGWAKVDSSPIKESRLFQMDIGFVKYDGTILWKTITFNDDVSQWQYASGEVIAPEDYKSLQVYISYYQNTSTVNFDGIQLYKEEFGTSYQYDSKGNVVSTQDLAKQNSNFQYDGNNDLINSVDPKGNSFVYEYDKGDITAKKHNLTKATSAENVVYSFDYDDSGNPTMAMVEGDGLFIKSTAKYTSSGNYIDNITDSLGNVVDYEIDEIKGNVNKVTDAKGHVTSYSYDDKLNYLKDVSKVTDGQTIKNSYSYTNDRISAINHNNFSYDFQYDEFGNNKSVNVQGVNSSGQQESKNLITNTYETRNGNLKESAYGNEQKVTNIYDAFDRVVGKKFGAEERFRYQYDGNSNLALQEDLVNKKNYRYTYDLADRLNKITEIDRNTSKTSSEIKYSFDLNNNVAEINEKIKDNNYKTSYGYNKDNKNTTTIYGRNYTNKIAVDYRIEKIFDKLGRVKESKINENYNTQYQYKAGFEANSTTSQIEKIINSGKEIAYTYDKNGNIETIVENGKTIKYYYNELNEVIREDNGILGKTIVYSYDAGGNILNKKEYEPIEGEVTAVHSPTKVTNYTYEDAIWKDKLSSYNGKAITYDQIGNPLTYDGYNFTWEMGRQLKNINGNGKNISYKYNDSGIRTEKTVDGVTTNYHLVGDKVTFEGSGSDKIYYTYDASGKLVSMSLNSIETVNEVEGKSEIGIFEGSTNKSGMEYVNATIPGTENTVRAIKLNKGQSIPNIWSPLIALKPSTNYVLEFDYWSEEQEVQFNVDLFPDTLPERYPVAKTTVQKFKETISSASPDMTASSLRFFNNLSNPNPANIYITNIRVYEEGKTSEVNKEYFYVRNAQGDIISLVDKYGHEVVNYTYDTWGKLISIEGTLKDSLGVKNPYRYRGYRYDTETGLYYLQSRYYNPEWGRFINADAIAGSLGELLGHNIFAYTKNNPIMAKDPSGFRSVYTMDEETDEMREASYAAMNNAKRNQPAYKEPTALGIDTSQGKALSKGLLVSFVDELAEMHILDNISNQVLVVFNRAQARHSYPLMIPAPTSVKYLKGGLKALGVIGIFMTVGGVIDNYKEYGFGEATARSGIDLVAAVGGILGGPVGGVAASYGAELFKNYLFKRE